MELLENLPSLAAVLTPLLQDHVHHRQGIQTTHELHREAIKQAKQIHIEEVRVSKQLHDLEIGTAQRLHEIEVDLAQTLHNKEVKIARDLHDKEKLLALQLHIENLGQQLRHHTQQIKISIESARRENLRDVWIMKNRKADTLLITATLMFAAFIALVVEGDPPEEAAPGIITAFSACVGGAFFFLVLCMWLTMTSQARMAGYNIYNKHELYKCGRNVTREHRTFESFYHCHCSKMAHVSHVCFYLGTFFVVCATSIMAHTKFRLMYDNNAAALVFVSIAATSVFAVSIIQICFGTRVRQHKAVADDKDHLHYIIKDLQTTEEEVPEFLTAQDSRIMDKVTLARQQAQATARYSQAQTTSQLANLCEMPHHGSPRSQRASRATSPSGSPRLARRSNGGGHRIKIPRTEWDPDTLHTPNVKSRLPSASTFDDSNLYDTPEGVDIRVQSSTPMDPETPDIELVPGHTICRSLPESPSMSRIESPDGSSNSSLFMSDDESDEVVELHRTPSALAAASAAQVAMAVARLGTPSGRDAPLEDVPLRGYDASDPFADDPTYATDDPVEIERVNDPLNTSTTSSKWRKVGGSVIRRLQSSKRKESKELQKRLRDTVTAV